MADAKKKLPTISTPVGLAGFMHTAEPDTKGPYADNKYKASILFPKEGANNQDDINAFVKRVQDAHSKAGGVEKDCPVKDGDKGTSDKIKGYWTFRAKSIYPAVIADASRKALSQTTPIWGGDVVILSFQPKAYNTGTQKGLTCYFKGDQFLKKGEGNQQSAE